MPLEALKKGDQNYVSNFNGDPDHFILRRAACLAP
jgi:hypothetical protein